MTDTVDAIDAVVFASPLTAKRFFRANPDATGATAIAIGSTTADWLRNHDIDPIEANGTDTESLARAVLRVLA